MGILTEADRTMLPMALRQNKGFHIAAKWYCRNWEALWYQYLFHQATQPNVTWLAGIAGGKSTGVAASYLLDCLTIPYFRALNTSVTAKQAEIPFEIVNGWIENNPNLEHLIEDVSLRPYPTVHFHNSSEWIFRTMGKDARFIRGLEFDRINVDEAGLDPTGEALKVLRGRLRGIRADGTKRMARLDVITSPTDVPWLRDRFDRGWKDNAQAELNRFLSLRTTTYENTKLDREQIALMEAEYTDDMIEVELNAQFPDYGMSFFPKSHIYACTDQSLNDAVELALRPEEGAPKPGYRVEENPRYGITTFELPRSPKGLYIMAGDPGTDSPPKRNAGCVTVFDVAKRPAKLVYFDWTDGRGSYNPFLSSFKYAMQKYSPILKGMDTTGTQKAIDELAFENMGLEIDGINFTRDKEAMLNSLSMMVTNHEIVWPVIKGITRQMGSYNRDTEKKLPQDIVMTLCQVAYLSRFVMEGTQPPEETTEPTYHTLSIRHRNQRTNVSIRRRR